MTIRRGISQAGVWLAEVLFPLFCLKCGAEGSILCSVCRAALSPPGFFACPLCHRPRAGGRACRRCRSDSALDSHSALAAYREDDIWGRLIRTCKYQYVSQAVLALDPAIAAFCRANPFFFGFGQPVVIPVPLHPCREAERGFNQASLVALSLAAALGLRVAPLLARPAWTRQQAKLGRGERERNVRGAFSLARGVSEAPRAVILADDVYTTGSTMQECARVLKAAGAGWVTGFTLARG